MPNELQARFKDWPVFTTSDAYLLLKSKHKVSKSTVQVTISRMTSSGRLFRVSKGAFSFKNNSVVAGFSYSPFYYGGLCALMIQDLIDDQVIMEVMTTRSIRRKMSESFNDTRLILHHISKKHFFGFRNLQYGGLTVPVSDPEKTLIDLFHYRLRLSIQDYGDLLKAISRRKVQKYLEAYDRHTKTTVLNFVRKYKPPADRGELTNPY